MRDFGDLRTPVTKHTKRFHPKHEEYIAALAVKEAVERAAV